MAIEPTNMARLCTDKWQPLWVKLDAHKYCQIFVSPYTWDYLYYYNNEWHNVGESDMYYYDRTRWVKVTDEWLKLQYSNKVRDFNVTPTTMYTVTLTTNGSEGGSLTLNWTPIEAWTEISVAEWTSITVNDTTLTIWDYTVVAVVEQWYHFVGWTEENRWDVPATVTWDLVVEAEFMDSPWYHLEWLNKVDDEHYNECVSILMEWEWTWYIAPEAFNSYTELMHMPYTISDTAEWVDEGDITITLGENDDPDTMDAFPYVCNASYSGDLSGFAPGAYVATVTIQDVGWEEVLDIWTLTLNRTGAA